MSSSIDSLSIVRTAAIVGTMTLGLLSIKYHDRALFTEKREGIKFIPGSPIVGGLIDQLKNKDRLLDNILDIMQEHDAMTVYTTALGLLPSILTIDDRNVEHVLKNNFSNYVKGPQMLTAMGDLFGHGIFVANGNQWKWVFIKEVDLMSNRIFDKKAESGKPVDFHDVIYKFTLDSFVLIGFGKQLNALLSKDKVPFAASFDTCQSNCFERFVDPFTNLRDVLRPILQPGTLRIKQHLQVIDDFAYTLIRERREQLKDGREFKDLLSRFMNAKNENNETLTDKELRDTVLNFIIAGRDTTAQALSWCFYSLMLHPRIETKLLNEIEQKIPNDISSMSAPDVYEVIKKMTYAHAVFYEILRLYPSVPSNVKVALEDDVLPDGSPVKKGDSISWSPYAMGRSEKLWGPDAKSFKPERWIQENGELKRESAGHWPAFHAGPRICLGQNLATLEALIAIIMLLKRYKFSLVPSQTITYDLSLTHPMKYGMHVFVERR